MNDHLLAVAKEILSLKKTGRLSQQEASVCGSAIDAIWQARRQPATNVSLSLSDEQADLLVTKEFERFFGRGSREYAA